MGGGTVMGVMVLLFFLFFAISAMILRAACGLVGETAPELGRAMMIVGGAVCVNFVAGLVLSLVGMGDVQIVTTPVSAACTAWVYSQMLPTTLGRGFMIWLAQIVVVVILAVVASFALAALFGGAAAMMAH